MEPHLFPAEEALDDNHHDYKWLQLSFFFFSSPSSGWQMRFSRPVCFILAAIRVRADEGKSARLPSEGARQADIRRFLLAPSESEDTRHFRHQTRRTSASASLDVSLGNLNKCAVRSFCLDSWSGEEFLSQVWDLCRWRLRTELNRKRGRK